MSNSYFQRSPMEQLLVVLWVDYVGIWAVYFIQLSESQRKCKGSVSVNHVLSPMPISAAPVSLPSSDQWVMLPPVQFRAGLMNSKEECYYALAVTEGRCHVVGVEGTKPHCLLFSSQATRFLSVRDNFSWFQILLALCFSTKVFVFSQL